MPQMSLAPSTHPDFVVVFVCRPAAYRFRLANDQNDTFADFSLWRFWRCFASSRLVWVYWCPGRGEMWVLGMLTKNKIRLTHRATICLFWPSSRAASLRRPWFAFCFRWWYSLFQLVKALVMIWAAQEECGCKCGDGLLLSCRVKRRPQFMHFVSHCSPILFVNHERQSLLASGPQQVQLPNAVYVRSLYASDNSAGLPSGQWLVGANESPMGVRTITTAGLAFHDR